MRKKIGFLLPLFIPLGYFAGWALRRKWGIAVSSPVFPSDGEFAEIWLGLMRIPILFYLSGFSVFAVGICFGGIFLLSLFCGIGGTDNATAVFLLRNAFVLAADTAVGMAACAHGTSLHSAAPSLGYLMRREETRHFTFGFLLACLLLALAAGWGVDFS